MGVENETSCVDSSDNRNKIRDFLGKLRKTIALLLASFLIANPALADKKADPNTGKDPKPGWNGEIKQENSKLVEFYEQGEINFQSGEIIDLGDFVFGQHSEIVASPDSSFFIRDETQCNIAKFDQQGNLLKIFGKKGKGPGDLLYPGRVSFSSNHELFVMDIFPEKKISIFDAEGNFQRVIKTEKRPRDIALLKENRIGYLVNERISKAVENNTKNNFLICVKNIKTGEEITVGCKYVLPINDVITVQGINFYVGKNYFARHVFIAGAKEGNLLVGLSTEPKINVYSPKGEKLSSFDLKMKPPEISEEFKEKFKKQVMSWYEKKEYWEQIKNDFEKKLSGLLGKCSSHFRGIKVDPEGNILVFPERTSFEEKEIKFQVYSSEGVFICETTIKSDDYILDVEKLQFTKQGIFAIVEDKEGELLVIKVPISKQSSTVSVEAVKQN